MYYAVTLQSTAAHGKTRQHSLAAARRQPIDRTMLLALKLCNDRLCPRLVLVGTSKGNRLHVGCSDGAAGDVVVVEKLNGEDVSEARAIMSRCQSGLRPFPIFVFSHETIAKPVLLSAAVAYINAVGKMQPVAGAA